jgi:hypothetical protein
MSSVASMGLTFLRWWGMAWRLLKCLPVWGYQDATAGEVFEPNQKSKGK